MNEQLLARQAEIIATYAEIEGMKAENQHRLSRNETIAYNEEHFFSMSSRLMDIRNYLLNGV